MKSSLSVAVSSMWIFSMELENAVGIYDKMQVVYKEMTSDIVKNYTSNPLESIISH